MHVDTVREGILEVVKVSGAKWFGGKHADVVALDKEEVDQFASTYDDIAKFLAAQGGFSAKLLAFRCVKALPVTANIALTIGPQVYSS